MAVGLAESRLYARDKLPRGATEIVDVAGVPTRILRVGHGEPLVLIHGGDFGSLYSLDGFSLVIEDLARDFEVFAFDKLGQGHTGLPTAYSWDALYAHARGVLELLGVRGAHLVGHSMGALLAVRLALDEEGVAASVTIVDSNTVAPDDPAFPWGRFYSELREREPGGPPGEASVRLEPAAQAWDPAWITDDFVARMLEIAQRPEMAEARRAIDGDKSTWMPSLLPVRRATLADIDRAGLPVPTLVLWGYGDRSAPHPLALSLFRRLAPRTEDAQLHLLHGAAHYCFRDRPLAFTRVLRGFCG